MIQSLDYCFFFIIFSLIANTSLQIWLKYFRINEKTVDGSKLVELYIEMETVKNRRKHG